MYTVPTKVANLHVRQVIAVIAQGYSYCVGSGLGAVDDDVGAVCRLAVDINAVEPQVRQRTIDDVDDAQTIYKIGNYSPPPTLYRCSLLACYEIMSDNWP